MPFTPRKLTKLSIIFSNERRTYLPRSSNLIRTSRPGLPSTWERMIDFSESSSLQWQKDKSSFNSVDYDQSSRHDQAKDGEVRRLKVQFRLGFLRQGWRKMDPTAAVTVSLAMLSSCWTFFFAGADDRNILGSMHTVRKKFDVGSISSEVVTLSNINQPTAKLKQRQI